VPPLTAPRDPLPTPRPAPDRTSDRLGDVLVLQGLLTRQQLADALVRRIRLGEKLGTVLLARGLVTRQQLYVALAEVWDTELVALRAADVDPDLLALFDLVELTVGGWVPVAVELTGAGEQQVVVAFSDEPSPDVLEAVTARTGIALVRPVVSTDQDVELAVGSARSLDTSPGDRLV